MPAHCCVNHYADDEPELKLPAGGGSEGEESEGEAPPARAPPKKGGSKKKAKDTGSLFAGAAGSLLVLCACVYEAACLCCVCVCVYEAACLQVCECSRNGSGSIRGGGALHTA